MLIMQMTTLTTLFLLLLMILILLMIVFKRLIMQFPLLFKRYGCYCC